MDERHERPILTATELAILKALRRECKRRAVPLMGEQLATITHIPRSSTLRALVTLRERGLVTRIGERLGYVPSEQIEQIREKQMATA